MVKSKLDPNRQSIGRSQNSQNSALAPEFVAGMKLTMTPSLTQTGMISPSFVVTVQEQFVERVVLRILMGSDKVNRARAVSEIKDKFEVKKTLMFIKMRFPNTSRLSLYYQYGLILLARHIIVEVLQMAGGDAIKQENLGIICTFDSTEHAVISAFYARARFLGLLEGKNPETQIIISFGIGEDNFLMFPNEVYGDVVNSTAKLALNADSTLKGGVSMLESTFDNHTSYVSSSLVTVNRYSVTMSGVKIFAVKLEPGKRAQKELDTFIETQRSLKGFPIALDKLCPEEQKILGDIRKRYWRRMSLPSWMTPTPNCPSSAVSAKGSTLIVTDLAGFTKYTKEFGILYYYSIIVKLRIVYRDQLKLHDGKLIRYQGDNVLAVFQHPADAVRAAIGARDVVQGFNNKGLTKFDMNIRIGVETGEAHIYGRDVLGYAFDYASYVSDDEAKLGEVFIGPNTYKELVGYKEFTCVKRTFHIGRQLHTGYAVSMQKV